MSLTLSFPMHTAATGEASHDPLMVGGTKSLA